MIVALEVLFVLAGLFGVAMWSVPAALVIGAVLGVIALERKGAARP